LKHWGKIGADALTQKQLNNVRDLVCLKGIGTIWKLNWKLNWEFGNWLWDASKLIFIVGLQDLWLSGTDGSFWDSGFELCIIYTVYIILNELCVYIRINILIEVVWLYTVCMYIVVLK